MASTSIVTGFRSDTSILLRHFVKQNSTNFECFCDQWKRMDFQYVFFGYSCLSEMLQFLEDAFIVLKCALFNATTNIEQIGALYLMYAMYFKQPTKQYCKFRMTMDEWIKMNQVYHDVFVAHEQASLVFWKLLQADAFRFVEAEYEYGFERFMQKGMSKVNDENKFRKINPVIQSALDGMQNKTTVIIPALEILQVGYNEMKEHLDQASPTTGLLATTSITSDILEGLGRIEMLVNPASELSKELSDPSGDESVDEVQTTRSKIKQKASRAQPNKPVARSSGAKKMLSQKYRGSITDDGEFIHVERPSTQGNSKKPTYMKTVVKQLELPFDGESELILPDAGTSTRIKSEKSNKSNEASLSLPEIFSSTMDST